MASRAMLFTLWRMLKGEQLVNANDGDGDDAMDEVDNPFCLLPREVMVKIVNCFFKWSTFGGKATDLRALIMFSSCDKYLQNLICKEFAFLWQDIDLSSSNALTDDPSNALTDPQLHALLERINAKQVVRNLRLSATVGLQALV